MKENLSYKTLKRLLEKVSLKPQDSDWDKMSSLLDKNLPVDGVRAKPIKAMKYFPGSVAVILITATIVLLHQKNRHTFEQVHNTALKTAAVNSQTLTADSAGLHSLGVDSTQGHGLNSEQIKDANVTSSPNYKKRVDLYSSNRNRLRNADSSAMTEPTNNKMRRHHMEHVAGYYSDKSTDNPRRGEFLSGEGGLQNRNDNVQTGMKADYKVRDLHSSRLKEEQSNEILSEQNSLVSSAKDEQEKQHTAWLAKNAIIRSNTSQRILLQDKTSGNAPKYSKSNGKGSNPASSKNISSQNISSSAFQYGFSLPLLNLYPSASDNKLLLNYIPGVTASYFFNHHLGLGITITPYETSKPGNDDSSYSIYNTYLGYLAFPPDTSKKYYINRLNTASASIRLIYRTRTAFSIEGGFGMQDLLSASGYVVTSFKQDSLHRPPIQQNIHYPKNDSNISTLQKMNFFYYVNVVYSYKQWDLLVGYSQNANSWFNNAGGKASGWLSLEIRYYLPGKNKK